MSNLTILSLSLVGMSIETVVYLVLLSAMTLVTTTKNAAVQLRTRQDTELASLCAPPATILSIQATKVIVDSLTSIEAPTDIDSVAIRTGYSPHQIKQILNSPQYRELVIDACRDRIAPVLVRNLKHLEKLVDDPETHPSTRLNVNRELRQTWEALNEHSPTQDKDERAAAALAALDSIRARKSLVTVTTPEPKTP